MTVSAEFGRKSAARSAGRAVWLDAILNICSPNVD
jgi:hypothetical protein